MNFSTKNYKNKKHTKNFMSKNLKNLFLILCVAFISFSCSSDDDSSGDSDTTAQNKANIIGTWKFTSSTTNGVLDTDNDPCLTQLTITFNTTQVSTLDIYGENCELSDTYTTTYSISGNNINIVDDGETYTVEITTLNSTTLTIEDSEDNDVYTETYTKQ
jgi:hypothetical protein